jgi:hypothetical protein
VGVEGRSVAARQRGIMRLFRGGGGRPGGGTFDARSSLLGAAVQGSGMTRTGDLFSS